MRGDNNFILETILRYCRVVSTHRAGAARPSEDLTARARIRDAALDVFAERGVARARLKDIADAAGVSIGLVQHHFGTKDALRQACDDHVMATVVQGAGESVAGPDPDALAALFDGSERGVRYLARALVDGSPAAATFFTGAVGVTAEFLTANWPERFPPGAKRTRDAAAVMSAMHAATVVLHEQLSRELGVDALTPDGAPVIGAAMTDVYAAMGGFAETAAGRRVTGLIAERAKERGDD
ncbi:MAG: TetR family transcriptional regulator [Streptosporangiales bacterium]|nr:TetR family transcriptional regulator [Streptosporangiales bacterium]